MWHSHRNDRLPDPRLWTMKLLKYHSVWGPNNKGVVFLYSKHGLEIVMVIKKYIVGNFLEERKRWKYVWFLIYLSVWVVWNSASLASLTRETGPKVVKGDPARKSETPKHVAHAHEHHFTPTISVSDSSLKFTHFLYNLSPAGTWYMSLTFFFSINYFKIMLGRTFGIILSHDSAHGLLIYLYQSQLILCWVIV